MDLRNLKVNHKTFGVGTVSEQQESLIVVSFNAGNKRFQYPEAFDGFLTIANYDISNAISALIAEKKASQIRAQLELVQEREQEYKQLKNTADIRHTKSLPRFNIAFKCNYCDGGKSEEQIGFHGVCSDALIHNNIQVEHRTWCGSAECPCFQYFQGDISRAELDSVCNDGGFVCYESQMLRDWKAFAGKVQNGLEKGRPMKLNNVQTNSLCVLTTRDPLTPEEQRYIFAVFLVDESYEGDMREEGYVCANSRYCIKLSPDQAHQMLFWRYHANINHPQIAAWSSGLHRYFEDEQAAIILRDIAVLKKGTSDEDLANEFFLEFVHKNGLDTELLGENNGALAR